MLASSGEITEPCPVPISPTVTTPSSRTPAFNHLRMRRVMRLYLMSALEHEFHAPEIAESGPTTLDLEELAAVGVRDRRQQSYVPSCTLPVSALIFGQSQAKCTSAEQAMLPAG